MDSPTHKDTERNQISPLDDEAQTPNAYKVAIPPKQNFITDKSLFKKIGNFFDFTNLY